MVIGFIDNFQFDISIVKEYPVADINIFEEKFVAEFNIRPSPPPNCHFEMFMDDEDYQREICNDYAFNLQISDMRICEGNKDRPLTKNDLTNKDIY